MSSTTDTQIPPFIETVGDTLTQLVEGAAKVGRESTRTYVAGLNAIVEQQTLAYEASQQWVSGLVRAQSNLRHQLVESYDFASDELAKTGEEATKLAGEVGSEVGSEVAKSSRRAATRATRKQTEAVTRTSRRPTPARPQAASTDAHSGPAKWTGDAYDGLTAVEVVEQLPQFSQRDLVEVETYEKAHQSRQTVLQKIASLRGQEPVPGYDDLNVQEIHKQLTEGDVELAARVRDYERPRKNRDGVLNAADAQLSKS